MIVSLAEKPTDPRGGPKRAKWKSASQIETFKLCQRKWGFRTIEGIKASNRFAEAGTAYHDLIEPWLLHGTPLPADDIGQRILAGLHYLPPPGIAEVEREFWLRTPVATYTGKVDWAFREDASKPWPYGPGGYGSGLWILGDNKSTSDLKWAKTPDELLEDVQAMIYATEAFVRFPSDDEIQLRWTYFQRRGARKSIQVVVPVTRSHALAQFEQIEAVAAEMCEIELSGARAADLPPNASACEMFGGCPYRDVCNLTPTERMKSIMAQESLREKMLKRAAAKAAQAGAPATPAPSTPSTPSAVRRPPGFPVRQAGTDGINPPEAPEVIAPTGEAEAAPAADEGEGLCTCGAVVPLAGGKIAEHKRANGFRCPGTGKAPLPPEAGEAAAKEEPKASNVTKLPEVKREIRPPEVSAPAAGELSQAEEDAQVLVLLETFEPGAVRAAREAVRKLRSM